MEIHRRRRRRRRRAHARLGRIPEEKLIESLWISSSSSSACTRRFRFVSFSCFASSFAFFFLIFSFFFYGPRGRPRFERETGGQEERKKNVYFIFLQQSKFHGRRTPAEQKKKKNEREKNLITPSAARVHIMYTYTFFTRFFFSKLLLLFVRVLTAVTDGPGAA